MVKRILILFALSLYSWGIYAQDILSIHTIYQAFCLHNVILLCFLNSDI